MWNRITPPYYLYRRDVRTQNEIMKKGGGRSTVTALIEVWIVMALRGGAWVAYFD
jgi:hypothetical protein